MKRYVYNEGAEARKNFQEGMQVLFKIPKAEVAKVEKSTRKLLPAHRVYANRLMPTRARTAPPSPSLSSNGAIVVEGY